MHPVRDYTNKIKSQREQISNGVHIPVLLKEVLQYLDPKPNENFIDCTIGFGGHSKAILKKNGPEGKVLGIERDKEIFEELSSFEIGRLILINDSYVNLEEIVKKNDFKPVSGILFDLGMSSWHLDDSGRGFSFLKDEPLDMRYNLENNLTAEKILNTYSQKDIEQILREYGQERFARKISKKIVENRPFTTTLDLKEALKKLKVYSFKRIFQALRIAVNEELSSFGKALPKALDILGPGGRLVIISFHSLEDRIVKNFFKNPNLNPVRNNASQKEISKSNEISHGMKILTKKPIIPSEEEIKINPRSSSAKLRAAIKK